MGVVVLALTMIGAANASAAYFTYSAPGSLTGKAITTQVFTVNGGQVKCSTAAISGSLDNLNLSRQHYTVNYSGCTAFGLGGVHISPATYSFRVNGEVEVLNTITITSTLGGCDLSVGPQMLKSLSYANNGNRLQVTANISGITYTSTGGLCGSSGANGAFTGTTEIERVGGG